MHASTTLLVLSCLLVGGCSGKSKGSVGAELDAGDDAGGHGDVDTPPPLDRQCESDEDCGAVGSTRSGEHACCFACDDFAVTTTSKAEFDAWCDRRTLEDCPEPHCVRAEPRVARCVDGECAMVLTAETSAATSSTGA